MARTEIAATARALRHARGEGAPGLRAVAAYAARQAWVRARGRWVESLAERRLLDDRYAALETPAGTIVVPRSLERNELAALLRGALDPLAWHRYDGPWAPLHSGAVVVDCGASVGVWAAVVAPRASRLVLVEPQDELADALERTFAGGLRDGRVELHRCGLGAEDGQAALAGSGLTAKLAPGEGPVPVRRLDTLLGGRRIDFVKADVEGAELGLLLGATETIARHRPTLAITVYHPENDWRELRDTVLELAPGYAWRTRGLEPGGKPLLLLLQADHSNGG